MQHMFRAIRRVLDEHPDCKAVYPIHMNPVVREAAEAELGGCERIHIIEPIDVPVGFRRSVRPTGCRCW